MRTTVDLPAHVHERVKRLAGARGQSISATIAELTTRGLLDISDPSPITVNPTSGLPTIRTGRLITGAEVAELIDED